MSREGSGVRRRKCICWRRMCQCNGSSTRGRVWIRYGTDQICNGRNRGLESALRGMSQAKMDLGIFK